jgi:hypothetical protein
MFPQHKLCAMQGVFCFAALTNAIMGTMYTDIPGAFPVRLFKSMQYIFVAYVYDLNVIIVCIMPYCTDASMVTAFTKVITILNAGGYQPALNVMDNECSAAIKKYIKFDNINIQLIPPHKHCVNAAERAIATLKEHFIAALATMDTHCPLQLWDEFLPQVELTLNMLRFSQKNPNKSANQEVYSSFDFTKTPLAPLGTKALIYDDPSSRASWAPHATDGFYVGPASNHYRCLRFYIPSTLRFQFSDTWHLYPTRCQILVTSQHDLSIVAAADILKTLGNTVPTTTMEKIRHIRAIQNLTAIMTGQQEAPEEPPSPRVVAPTARMVSAPPPRVATTSKNITAPNVIRTLPLVHQRHTCNNNPFNILADDDDDDDTVVASNCSPRVPPLSLPPSDLQGNPPAHQPTLPLANQPTSLLPTLYTSRPPTTPPPRVLAIPTSLQAITPMAPHTCIHDLRPNTTRKPSKTPAGTNSSQSTHCPLLNLMTNEMRCPP